jgi:hypothetical protein
VLNRVGFGTEPLRRRELEMLTEILRRLRVEAGDFDEKKASRFAN